MSGSADRRKAASLLVRVEGGAFASRLLGRVSSAGVRARVMGVLRNLRHLDGAIEGAAGRRITDLDPEVRTALRVGLFEITGLGVPAPVAGDGAVRLVRSLGRAAAAGLVNAVIRRAPDHWRRLAADGPPAVRLSHPDWLWQRWSSAFGPEQAEASMAAAQEPADLWVWFSTKEAPARIAAAGVSLTPHPWMPGAWRAEGSDLIGSLRAGDAYAQDPASQLVAWLVAAGAEPGDRLLDLCAAPGGKVARAGRDGEWSLAVAGDFNLGRLQLALPLLRSAKPAIPAVVQDARRPAVSAGRWNVVLLDAPCTGTGTLRRHPELRWRLRRKDVAERSTLQRQMLAGAFDLVAPGGLLVYSTCSIEAEENEDHFRVVPPGFEACDLASNLPPGAPAIPTGVVGGFRFMPGPDCDGFTIHGLRRL